MDAPELKPNHIVRGAIFPEPVKILTIVPLGEAIKLIGEGLETGRVHQPILTAEADCHPGDFHGHRSLRR